MIWPACATPVPREDIQKLREAIRERVVKPLLARRAENWRREQAARMRPIFPRLPATVGDRP